MTADTPSPSEVGLLPCPFCGGSVQEAPPMDDGTGVCWHVENGCILSGLWFPTTKWNTRAPSPRPSTVDEATVGWQPIETAPKDGRYLIVAKFSEAPDQPVLGWVKHSRWITPDEIADLEGGDPSDYDAGWTDGNDDSEPCYPTHWQPLEPPASLPSVAVQPIGEQ